MLPPGGEALELLEGVDVVLLDHQLPDTTGLEVLEAIRTRPQPPAVILITAHGNESLAATALRRGADDYLAKDVSLAELLPQVLERVRRTRELRKALVAAERDLVRAERFAAIGEMTVTLHHEINNPLMAAFAHVELLLADPSMDAEARRETLSSVREALHRIRDIVRRIGDLREIRTKSYATGVQMVDLDDVGPASAVRRGQALVLVTDEDLARIVSLLLKHAGFEVVRAGDGARPVAARGRRPGAAWWWRKEEPTRREPTRWAGSCRRRTGATGWSRWSRETAPVRWPRAPTTSSSFPSTPAPSPPRSSSSPAGAEAPPHFPQGTFPILHSDDWVPLGPGPSIRAASESDPSFR